MSTRNLIRSSFVSYSCGRHFHQSSGVYTRKTTKSSSETKSDFSDTSTWDFLLKGTKNNDEVLVSAEPRDRYAKVISGGGVKDERPSVDEDLANPLIRKKDLDPFHVHRPIQSDPNLASSVGTKKEQLIFTTLLESIFSQKTVPKKTGPSKSLQTLFQQSIQRPELQRAHESDASEIEIIEDIRKVPLSSGSVLNKSKQDFAASDRGKLERVAEILQPILKYMSTLPTDHEVVEYYTKKIVARSQLKEEYQVKLDQDSQIDVLTPPVNAQTVSIYLLKAMDLLITDFQAPSEAITLFELSKRSGIEFYVASCSTDVYNKMLELRWNYFRDLYAVESLMSEMYVNAVAGNNDTVNIIGKIHRDYIGAKHGLVDGGSLSLWNKEDSRRMKSLNQYRLRVAKSLMQGDETEVPSFGASLL